MAWFLILIFLVLPATEIYLFIEIGGWLGAGTTIALTIATAFIGAFLVRAQGMSVARRAQESMERGEAPVQEALDGVALFVAGVLLVVPGFFTDAIGALLLIPLVRQAMGVALMTKLLTMRVRTRTQGPDGSVVDADFEVVRPDRDQAARPSGTLIDHTDSDGR